jgi:cytochrome P450
MDFEALTKLPADARIKELFAYFEDRRAHEAAGASSQPNVWEVFRYDEAMAVLSDHETFSSDKTALIPEDQKRLAQAARGNFIGVDPPLHTRMRSLVNKAFTPGVITRLEPRIRVLSDNLLDTVFGEAGPGDEVRFDLAQDFASQLSAAVIAELFGIPEADHKVFWTWSDGLIGSRPFGELGTVDEAAMRRIGELLTEASNYLMAHIADRRTNPRDDLTTTLARVEVEGRRHGPDRGSHVDLPDGRQHRDVPAGTPRGDGGGARGPRSAATGHRGGAALASGAGPRPAGGHRGHRAGRYEDPGRRERLRLAGLRQP